MALRVVVEATSLADGSAVRGIGAALRPLCDGLASVADLELVLLGAADVRLRGPGRLRAYEHALVSGRAARRAGGEVTWFPANLPSLLPPRPFVVTVHDAIPLLLDDPGLSRDRRRWRLQRHALGRASRVLCPSRATAATCVEVLGLDPARVEIVPWGVADRFTPDGPVADVGHPHLLWVSAYDPHKGLAESCALVAGLAARGLPHRLRLVGPFDDRNRRLIDGVVAASPRPDLIDVVGWVDDLPAAYRAASAFVITSRIEGFGLPPVEAQACGTPVVGFHAPAVTEVAGPGARLVAAGDVGALVDATVDLLTDADLRAERRGAGLANAARFSWPATVDAYAAAFRRAAIGAGRR